LVVGLQGELSRLQRSRHRRRCHGGLGVSRELSADWWMIRQTVSLAAMRLNVRKRATGRGDAPFNRPCDFTVPERRQFRFFKGESRPFGRLFQIFSEISIWGQSDDRIPQLFLIIDCFPGHTELSCGWLGWPWPASGICPVGCAWWGLGGAADAARKPRGSHDRT